MNIIYTERFYAGDDYGVFVHEALCDSLFVRVGVDLDRVGGQEGNEEASVREVVSRVVKGLGVGAGRVERPIEETVYYLDHRRGGEDFEVDLAGNANPTKVANILDEGQDVAEDELGEGREMHGIC